MRILVLFLILSATSVFANEDTFYSGTLDCGKGGKFTHLRLRVTPWGATQALLSVRENIRREDFEGFTQAEAFDVQANPVEFRYRRSDGRWSDYEFLLDMSQKEEKVIGRITNNRGTPRDYCKPFTLTKIDKTPDQHYSEMLQIINGPVSLDIAETLLALEKTRPAIDYFSGGGISFSSFGKEKEFIRSYASFWERLKDELRDSLKSSIVTVDDRADQINRVERFSDLSQRAVFIDARSAYHFKVQSAQDRKLRTTLSNTLFISNQKLHSPVLGDNDTAPNCARLSLVRKVYDARDASFLIGIPESYWTKNLLDRLIASVRQCTSGPTEAVAYTLLSVLNKHGGTQSPNFSKAAFLREKFSEYSLMPPGLDSLRATSGFTIPDHELVANGMNAEWIDVFLRERLRLLVDRSILAIDGEIDGWFPDTITLEELPPVRAFEQCRNLAADLLRFNINNGSLESKCLARAGAYSTAKVPEAVTQVSSIIKIDSVNLKYLRQNGFFLNQSAILSSFPAHFKTQLEPLLVKAASSVLSPSTEGVLAEIDELFLSDADPSKKINKGEVECIAIINSDVFKKHEGALRNALAAEVEGFCMDRLRELDQKRSKFIDAEFSGVEPFTPLETVFSQRCQLPSSNSKFSAQTRETCARVSSLINQRAAENIQVLLSGVEPFSDAAASATEKCNEVRSAGYQAACQKGLRELQQRGISTIESRFELAEPNSKEATEIRKLCSDIQRRRGPYFLLRACSTGNMELEQKEEISRCNDAITASGASNEMQSAKLDVGGGETMTVSDFVCKATSSPNVEIVAISRTGFLFKSTQIEILNENRDTIYAANLNTKQTGIGEVHYVESVSSISLDFPTYYENGHILACVAGLKGC